MAAVQTLGNGVESIDLVPDELFKPGHWTTTLMSKLSVQNSASTDVHALTLLARILQDDALKDCNAPKNIMDVMDPEAQKKCTAIVLRHIKNWRFDASNLAELDRKLKEIIWTVTLIYVSGWKQGKRFRNDFFL